MKWVCFPKFYSPLANWPWLRISPQSSLYVIYCLILIAWQWLMSFTCIPVQNEPNKSPLGKRLLALLLWEIGHLSSPSRSCLGRFIFICGGWGGLQEVPPHTLLQLFFSGNILISSSWLNDSFAAYILDLFSFRIYFEYIIPLPCSQQDFSWELYWLPHRSSFVHEKFAFVLLLSRSSSLWLLIVWYYVSQCRSQHLL